MSNVIDIFKNNQLDDTGVWIEFDYKNKSTYPPEMKSYLVNDGYGGEILALWDTDIECWLVDGIFFVEKWLLEESR